MLQHNSKLYVVNLANTDWWLSFSHVISPTKRKASLPLQQKFAIDLWNICTAKFFPCHSSPSQHHVPSDTLLLANLCVPVNIKLPYVFTQVCVSFCSQGGGSLSQHAPQVTWAGGLCPRVSLLGTAWVTPSPASRTTPRQRPPPPPIW